MLFLHHVDEETKVQLKIPQLTLAKIAQLGRHEAVNTRSALYGSRVKGSNPVRENLYRSNTILAKLTD